MSPTDGRQYSCRASVPHDIANAKWGIAEEVRPQEEWRIHDGDWFLDAWLGNDVTYDVAARIVLAIKRKTFIDRRDPSNRNYDVAQVLSGGRVGIGLEGTAYKSGPDGQLVAVPANPLGPEYKLSTGGGPFITVVVVGGQVELISAGMLIS